MAEEIPVEVVYALPERQVLKSFSVEEGCTALEAVNSSGILDEFPELKSDELTLGVFSHRLDGKLKPTAAEYVLLAHDRVEIYRPLLIDPKQARMQRAEKARQQSQKQKGKK